MNLLFTIAELVGTVAFALSGAMVAVQKRLDIFGIMLLGVVTALGGGTIRDVLLGHTPPRVFYSGSYVALSIVSALVVFVVFRLSKGRFSQFTGSMDALLTLSDALGLGIFAVIGARAGMTEGYGDNALLCIFLGMLTGVGGGVLRDMMCADIPFVLRKHVYAVAAIAGASVFYYTVAFGLDQSVASLMGMLTTFLMRVLAWHYRWNLPRAVINDPKGKSI